MPLSDPSSSICLLSVISIINGDISISLREISDLEAEPYA